MTKKSSKLNQEKTALGAPPPQFQTLPLASPETAPPQPPAVAESALTPADPAIDVLRRGLGTGNKELMLHLIQQACDTSPGPEEEGFVE